MMTHFQFTSNTFVNVEIWIHAPFSENWTETDCGHLSENHVKPTAWLNMDQTPDIASTLCSEVNAQRERWKDH